MGTAVIHDADAARAVAPGDELFAQENEPDGRAVGYELLGFARPGSSIAA